MTTQAAAADSLSALYPTTSSIKAGMLVAATDAKAVPASTQNCALAGVAIADAQDGQVEVASVGSTQMYVVESANKVKIGDHIGCSRITGVGQVISSGTAVGVVSNIQSTTSKITTNLDGKDTVMIPVTISLALTEIAPPASSAPQFARAIAQSLTEKAIPDWRIWTSLVVLALGFISSTILFVAGVRYALIATGRNPLSAPSVRKELLYAILAGVLLLVGSIAGAYLLIIW